MKTKEEKKKVIHSRPIFYGFLSLMLAICTARFVFAGNVKYIIFDVLILLILFGFCLQQKAFKALAVVFAFFAFGFAWFFVGQATFEGKTYAEPVAVVGRISDDVKYSEYNNSSSGVATVVLKDVTIDGKKEGNISLRISFTNVEEFKIGDIVAFEGMVENVHLFTLGKMNNWFYRDRTPYSCNIAVENMVVQGNNIKLDEKFRLKIKDTLFANMSEKNASVAYAVLFGNKNDLDQDVYDSYKSAGIVHLVAVSGLHVSFLMALLGWILKKCRVRGIWNLLICTFLLFVYAYLCGFAPSVLRAGIMGIVLFSASIFGKQYDRLCSAGLAGFLILLFSPLSALDIGFQLSFFCVFSIFVISPWISNLCKKFLPKKIAETFAISIGVTIGILPFLTQMDGYVNLLSFFVNFLIIPIFSVLFPVLFCSVLLCAFMPFLQFLLKCCDWGFEIIQKISDFFGTTHLTANVDEFGIFFIVMFFVFFFCLSKFFMASKKMRAICCCCAFAVGSLFFGLDFVQFPISSSISYGFDFSTSVVVLTNSTGQSMIVDMCSETFTKRLLNNLQIKNISTAFVLQTPTFKIDTANEIGVQTIIRSDDGQGYDQEILLSFDEIATYEGFAFVFRGQNNRVTGLEISFDETTVFVLKDWNTSVSAIQALPTQNYDFVILGKHQQYANLFDAKSKVMTYYTCPEADSTFVGNGNVSYDIFGKIYKRRCLD